jgi:co-chaperonin GroES (HSP10)
MATRAVAPTGFKPLNDYVLIRRIEDKDESQIITPDIAKVVSNKGTIVRIGDPLLCKNLSSGDVVLFTKYGAMDVEVDDEALVLVRYAEIYGRF